MNTELLEALNILEKEKDISKETLMDAIENSLLNACKSHFGKADNIKLIMDRDSCDYRLFAEKTVVEEVEDKFYQIIRVNIKMELEKNGFKVKEVFESMLDANASKISDYQGLIFVGYSTLWYQKKVFRQVVQGKLP